MRNALLFDNIGQLVKKEYRIPTKHWRCGCNFIGTISDDSQSSLWEEEEVEILSPCTTIFLEMAEKWSNTKNLFPSYSFR